MCEFLGISRNLVYYHLNKKDNFEKLENEEELVKNIKTIFKRSKNNYGTRKIKVEPSKINIIASRRKISRIMKENALVKLYS
jgi:ISSdy1 transposase